MDSSVLLVDKTDAVTALITLNRPERRNALTIQLMEVLCAALDDLAAEPERRIVPPSARGWI
jgi:enoyl-CoA hydratase/carnithine racemase